MNFEEMNCEELLSVINDENASETDRAAASAMYKAKGCDDDDPQGSGGGGHGLPPHG